MFVITLISLLWFPSALGLGSCGYNKQFNKTRDLATPEAQAQSRTFFDTQFCAVQSDVFSFPECYRHCNGLWSCVGFAFIQDQCMICNSDTNDGERVLCAQREKYILWRQHLLSLPLPLDPFALCSDPEITSQHATTQATDINLIQGDCSDGRYNSGSSCLNVQPSPSEAACPLSTDSPPPGNVATCQQLTDTFFYLHVGGVETATNTDAVCLSATTTIITLSGMCQYATTAEACAQLIVAAGCASADTDFCIGSPCVNGVCVSGMGSFTCTCHSSYSGRLCDQASSNTDGVLATTAASHPDINLIQGDCSDGRYNSGSSCLNAQSSPSEAACPLSADSPPPGNVATCQQLTDTFFYLHVGGEETAINTDAVCLSATTTIITLSGMCQYATTAEACAQLIVAAGCSSADTDYCSGNPCLNGDCVSALGSFSCTCASGYAGRLCNEAIFQQTSTSISTLTTTVPTTTLPTTTLPTTTLPTTTLPTTTLPTTTPTSAVNLIQGDCTDGKYNTGTSCLFIQSSPSISACPLSVDSPPPGHTATCQQLTTSFYYLHVGGEETATHTDAMCLSATTTVITLSGMCQYATTAEACAQLIVAAGCSSADADYCAGAPCVNGDCTSELGSFTCTCNTGYRGRICNTAEIDTSLIQGLCAAGMYNDGYGGCLDVQYTPSTSACPLSDINPPPGNVATCQQQTAGWRYLHVGGQSTEWAAGTDAMCLSRARQVAAYGTAHCQIVTTDAQCAQLIVAAGCTSA